jgi:hypothetical protein
MQNRLQPNFSTAPDSVIITPGTDVAGHRRIGAHQANAGFRNNCSTSIAADSIAAIVKTGIGSDRHRVRSTSTHHYFQRLRRR